MPWRDALPLMLPYEFAFPCKIAGTGDSATRASSLLLSSAAHLVGMPADRVRTAVALFENDPTFLSVPYR